MDCSPPGASVHGIFLATILEWIAISSSRGSSQPRNRTHISCFGSVFFTTKPLGNPFQKLPGVNSFPCPGLFSVVIVFISNIVKYIFLTVFHFGYFPPIIISSSILDIVDSIIESLGCYTFLWKTIDSLSTRQFNYWVTILTFMYLIL